MTSLAGPIAIQDVTALGEVTAVSDTGRLRMDSVIGAPMTFSTHYANIIAINTTSYSLTEVQPRTRCCFHLLACIPRFLANAYVVTVDRALPTSP